MSVKWSIITAVHNALAMNQLFWESLSQNTTSPFELVIVDNHSTDGTETFFERLSQQKKEGRRVVYLRNEFNQPYPVSMNQGMAAATGEIFGFLNNDIWLSPGWNAPFERELAREPRLVLSPTGQEAQPRQSLSDGLKRRWKWVGLASQIWAKVLGKSELERLKKTLVWMYGDLNQFASPTPQSEAYFHGIKGDSVVFHQSFPKEMPDVWDERFEAADWHLYLSCAKRHEQEPDFPLPRVLCDSYIHHYGRYSTRTGLREPMVIETPIKSIDEHWKADLERLWWGRLLPA